MTPTKNVPVVNRVLVVDDEPDIAELLEYNLIKEGYDVQTAANGKKALEFYKNALELDPESPHIYYFMRILFHFKSMKFNFFFASLFD